MNIKEYVPLEINHAFENTVSYSQYSTYLGCPHRWYLSYVKDLAIDEPTIFTVFGTSIHEALQHYLNLLYNDVSKLDDFDLVEYFNERFRENYKLDYEKYKSHFSSASEMKEFFEDGCNILNFFKQNQASYFKTKKFKLLGVEIPLLVKLQRNLYYRGYIDLVIEDEEDDKIIIYDIKTSTKGWTENDKKNETKISQVLLYKEFFAKQFNIDVNKVEVEYFVVKRKLYESKYNNSTRIQTFSPASGKIKRKKVMENFEEFVKKCFDENGQGIDREYVKDPGKACKYCSFSNKPDLCDKNKKIKEPNEN